MKPITHHELCMFIRSAIQRRNTKIEAVASQAKIPLGSLSLMLAGQAYFTVQALASLGKALGVDYSQLTAGYALWRYQEILASLNSAEREAEKQRGRYGKDELAPLAQSIVASNPGQPTELLIQHLMKAVPGIFEPIAATAIQRASSQKMGDYDAA